MGTFNILNTFIKKEKKKIHFLCPSCGFESDIKDTKCNNCSYGFDDYKKILFKGYLYLNIAIEEEKKENYFESFINILKFLAFFPKDEDGKKLYIYLLVKMGNIEKAKDELEKFERDHVRNPWLMEVYKDDIVNIKTPKIEKVDSVDFEELNSIELISNEYTHYRVKNINDILELVVHFCNLLSLYKNDKIYSKLLDFYSNSFIPFLSRKEIRLESFEGKSYLDLNEEEKAVIEIVGKKEDNNLIPGYIETIYPGIYLRSKCLSKQKVFINKIED